ncbi:hypothetical protein [Niveibacterium terrae]|uniref:hypothetical protein n=1 Tax=Niveibacterium terrae TaxID=3373598 RepID=UPI003A910A38
MVQPERRDSDHIFLELLKEQGAKLDRIADELRAHTQSEAQRMLAIEQGFPDDDPSGHRAYHEAIIRRAEQRAEFWQKLSVELAKWGLIGFLGWLAVAAYHEAMKGFGR